MAGLFGIWNWTNRQPAAGERTVGAWTILVAALISAAIMILGVAQFMFLIMPAPH